MNENPYASPEEVADDDGGENREELQRLRSLHGGLGWVLASGVTGAVLEFFGQSLLVPMRLHDRVIYAVANLGMIGVIMTLNFIGMTACARCPGRIVPKAGRLIMMSVWLTVAACACLLMAGKGSVFWWLGWLLLVASFLPWQLFLLRLARGLNHMGCRVLAVGLMVLWVAGWVSVPLLGTMTWLLVCLTGYVLFYMNLLWYLREAIFKEMEKWMKTFRHRRM